jgi:hypothetical protein
MYSCTVFQLLEKEYNHFEPEWLKIISPETILFDCKWRLLQFNTEQMHWMLNIFKSSVPCILSNY